MPAGACTSLPTPPVLSESTLEEEACAHRIAGSGGINQRHRDVSLRLCLSATKITGKGNAPLIWLGIVPIIGLAQPTTTDPWIHAGQREAHIFGQALTRVLDDQLVLLRGGLIWPGQHETKVATRSAQPATTLSGRRAQGLTAQIVRSGVGCRRDRPTAFPLARRAETQRATASALDRPNDWPDHQQREPAAHQRAGASLLI